MSEHVKEIDDAEFNVVTKSGLVLVDFWATWCGPCQMMAPVLDKVAGATPYVKCFKVDVDANTGAAGALGVQSIPTFVLFKDGVEVDRQVGGCAESDLVAFLAKHK